MAKRVFPVFWVFWRRNLRRRGEHRRHAVVFWVFLAMIAEHLEHLLIFAGKDWCSV